ncbi:hypothetical protein [Chelatococcus asaccharovorans]|uniref:Uncharacterized protein n=1 Tax=Chelatococcus asaccharovorans TaxID=28210 RepID=A0A2V3UBF2_9HYPH|nr:hypothetical protein [Chelatococcus asaccharovorans]MBS7703420.1 hypothetical protein [Chelatococcus asaccharovorans]PXW61759.1 hypothetical protein C7450_103277 [Chelatococcus asaccharovorans]
MGFAGTRLAKGWGRRRAPSNDLQTRVNRVSHCDIAGLFFFVLFSFMFSYPDAIENNDQISQVPAMSTTVDEIVAAYLKAEGDALAALNAAIRDALADLAEKERRLAKAERLISRGYVRGRMHATLSAAAEREQAEIDEVARRQAM